MKEKYKPMRTLDEDDDIIQNFGKAQEQDRESNIADAINNVWLDEFERA